MVKKAPLKNKHWYIVNIHKKSRKKKTYYYYPKSFELKTEAEDAIKRNFPGHELYYEVFTGEQIKEFGFVRKGTTIKGEVIKYDYPPELSNEQNRKSFRTKYRRWKRDFNLKLTRTHAAEKRKSKRNRKNKRHD